MNLKLSLQITHSELVKAVLQAALDAADPYSAVLRHLRGDSLLPRGETESVSGKVFVVGAGKAAAAMSRAVEEAFGDRIAGGLVVAKEGYTDTGGVPLTRIRLAEASHPVPDERGVTHTAEMLDVVREAGEGDLVVCLISGGGSALLTAPAEGISLDDVQETTAHLLSSGATINELNAVRKHLSTVAGGQLARLAAPARVLSLILSDVTGSPLDVIASGPTAPDPTTFEDALAIIERYGLLARLPASVVGRLQAGSRGEISETPSPGDPLFARVENRLVASNVLAVEAAAQRARELGLDVLIGSTYIEGKAREVGRALAGVAKEIAAYNRPVRRPGCVIFGGETTVTVRGGGTGGRNTELVLGAALSLDGWGDGVIVASLATDGGDGSSPSAGGVVDGTTIARGEEMGLDASAELADNNSYGYLSRVGCALVTGPTGTNVNDLMAVFVI